MWNEEEDEDDFEPVTLTLSRQQLAAIDAALGTIESTLADLVEQSTRIPPDPTELGGRQEIFCRETLMRMVQNPHLAEGETMYDTANEALRALDQLRPRLARMSRLGGNAEKIEWALSEHILFAAMLGYGALQSRGQHHGLEALRADLSWRRRGRNDRDFDPPSRFDDELPDE